MSYTLILQKNGPTANLDVKIMPPLLQ